MDKVFAVVRREFGERVRSKWFLVATLFGPLFIGVLIFLPAWLANKTRNTADVGNIVIVDASGNGLGAAVQERLGPLGSRAEVRIIAPAEIAAAESLATQAVVRKEREGYLVVDALTASGERARYAGRNASTVADMRLLSTTVRDAILGQRFLAAGLDAARVRELSNVKLDFDSERLTERGRGGAGEGAIGLAYVVAMLLYMSIVLYGQAVLMGVVEEKSSRVAEVVVASISPDKLLAGKVLGVGSVGLLQMMVWIVSALTMLRLHQPIAKALGIAAVTGVSIPQVTWGTALGFTCFFVLGYTLYASMFAAAGSMVSSTQDAQQVATPLTLSIVPSMLLLTPVLMDPGSLLSRVVTLIPFTAPILMPVRMSLTSVPLVEILLSVALLLAMCFVAIWAAARIYRVGVLMYGKKASFSEVARWVSRAR